MTAVAKLPDKWRAEADMYEAEHNNQHGYLINWESHGKATALERAADELEAALSPAELGGVPEAVAIEPNGLVMRGGIAAIGDYAIEKSPGCTRIVNAEFARGWNEARAAMLSTPRAAEADWLPIESAPKDGQTVLVGRDVGEPWGFVRGYAHYYGGGDGFVQGWISRGFTNPPGELGLAHPTHWRPLPAPPALTPPSAKGE